jgi:radical SAM/Cys-rich protein
MEALTCNQTLPLPVLLEMLDTAPLLSPTSFPRLRRGRLETLQVNLGRLCNQSCLHCHVDAGPRRTEQMTRELAEQVLAFMQVQQVACLDLTGGAPELNQNFRLLVQGGRRLGARVIDRCNLTVLMEPGQEGLAEFLAAERVEVVASLPCYLSENVDAQRGKGVFRDSIRGLQLLNRLGYGDPASGLSLSLVYNPQGPVLPPPQADLEADYRQQLQARYGIVFNQLLTLANMPIKRFGSMLLSKGQFHDYLELLRRSLLSLDWQGYAYDCDFNQMLEMPLAGNQRPHLSDLMQADLEGREISVAEHCYGCTAGQGSSCAGALR